MPGGRRRVAGVLVLAAALGGCDEPGGIARIHFLMNPPNLIDFGADAGPPPADLFDLSRATGTIQVFADIPDLPSEYEPHLTSEFEGLPTPSDPELAYLLWLSGSDHGGDWTLAGPLTLEPSGAAAAHLNAGDAPFDYLELGAAIVTLEPADTREPSRTVILTGVLGNEPEVEAAAPAGGGGVHQH
jgi:hypothetical protein